jgi:ATP-dependent Clp endopeptidase proteolytic subunit ClpP
MASAKQQSWYEIKAKADEAEIVIFDEIGFFGITAKDFLDDLKALGDVRAITLRINSPGGGVFDGNAIFNAMKRHPANVTVFVDGLAASIASVIAMAGDRVVMPENAMMMIHDPFGLVVGTSEEMARMADTLDKLKAGLVAAYRGKTGLPDDEIAALMSDETWMTAAEAVEKGFADEVEAPVQVAASFDLRKFKHPPKDIAAGLSGEPAAGNGGEIVSHEESKMADDKRTQAAGEDKPLTTEELIASMPHGVADHFRAEGRKEAEAAAAQAVKDERERIQAIEALAKGGPGNADLIAKAKDDPEMTAPDLAMALVEARKKSGAAQLAKLKDDEAADDAAEIVAGNTGSQGVSQSAPLAERAKAEWDKDPDLRAEFQDNFDRYMAFAKAKDSNRVHILRGKVA